jgi:hypothetical protein
VFTVSVPSLVEAKKVFLNAFGKYIKLKIKG